MRSFGKFVRYLIPAGMFIQAASAGEISGLVYPCLLATRKLAHHRVPDFAWPSTYRWMKVTDPWRPG